MSAAPPPKRGRGRPPLHWRDDSDRYAIAGIDALTGFGFSERAAIIFLTFRLVGIVDDCATFEKPDRQATLEGSLARLRYKRRHYPIEAVAWRLHVATAIGVAVAPKDRMLARAVVISLAARVGEDMFARRVLLPLLDRE